MTKSYYIIDYKVLDKNGNQIKEGIIKVKNKQSNLHAQTSLEDYLRKKVSNFNKLIVVNCSEENELMRIFKDIFGNETNLKN